MQKQIHDILMVLSLLFCRKSHAKEHALATEQTVLWYAHCDHASRIFLYVYELLYAGK